MGCHGFSNNSSRRCHPHRLGRTLCTPVSRIWMTESSNTCDSHGSADRRNCGGFAICGIYFGTNSAGGKIYDLLRHKPDSDQTPTYFFLVDPVPEASDIKDQKNQGGFDLFFT